MFNVPLYNPMGHQLGHYTLNWSPARAVGSRMVKAQLLQPGSAGWAEAEALVKGAFNQAYSADITLSYPQVMGLYVKGHVRERLEVSKEVLAVAAGMRSAEQGPLFLERYLPKPIESYFDCTRAEIVEMGSLASQEPGYSDILFSFIASQMKAQGKKIAVITATESLLNHLKKLELSPMLLGPAKLEMLTEAQRYAWGSYYDTKPQVCAFSSADIPLIEKKLRVQYIPQQTVTEFKGNAYALA